LKMDAEKPLYSPTSESPTPRPSESPTPTTEPKKTSTGAVAGVAAATGVGAVIAAYWNELTTWIGSFF
jgi:hypothetical protein